jgi:hypothetical protein
MPPPRPNRPSDRRADASTSLAKSLARVSVVRRARERPPVFRAASFAQPSAAIGARWAAAEYSIAARRRCTSRALGGGCTHRASARVLALAPAVCPHCGARRSGLLELASRRRRRAPVRSGTTRCQGAPFHRRPRWSVPLTGANVAPCCCIVNEARRWGCALHWRRGRSRLQRSPHRVGSRVTRWPRRVPRPAGSRPWCSSD